MGLVFIQPFPWPHGTVRQKEPSPLSQSPLSHLQLQKRDIVPGIIGADGRTQASLALPAVHKGDGSSAPTDMGLGRTVPLVPPGDAAYPHSGQDAFTCLGVDQSRPSCPSDVNKRKKRSSQSADGAKRTVPLPQFSYRHQYL